jgi:ATP-dependent Lhr-like helicase
MRKGRKNPPQLQRMEADDLMAAIFPALAACQENTNGPRVIPDHPIVRQTLHDCLHEAMDVRGLEQLVRAIEIGSVRVHFRDTTEASPLAHEILNARPYAYLDDAPLEERRTRAVQLRRGLPVEARALARLDPDAVARVVTEAAPAPRDRNELHDVLLSLVVCRPDDRWQSWFGELVREARATIVTVARAQFWCATERRALVHALFTAASFEPEVSEPLELAGAVSAEDAAATVVRGHLDVGGPRSADQLSMDTGLPLASVEAALALLEHEGFALRGQFTAPIATGEGGGSASISSAAPPHPAEFCSRRLLGRIHRYTMERLRREIEPVSAQDYMRFLLQWQHVSPSSRCQGRRGLQTVIEQLQGFEVAAGAWEESVLPLRVEGYSPEWLDLTCLSGEVCWGRLALRSRDAERGSREEPDTRSGSPQAPSRATPITLLLRGDLGWLMQAARGDKAPAEPSSPLTRSVISALAANGALFRTELAQAAGLDGTEVIEALWDAVARGLVSADGFRPLRDLLRGRAAATSRARHTGLRRGQTGVAAGDGRWALLRHGQQTDDTEALAEAVAEQLLARWGVVFYDVVARESLALPWREIVWALRRLEARGTVRGGRFVTGFVGEQYALPDAVERLRAVRRTERTGEVVRVSGADPLNLVGIIVPGARVAALRGNQVVYRDGQAVTDDAELTEGVRAAV